MSAVSEAAEALEAALATVPGLRGYRDPGAVIDPPAWVLGPPVLSFEAYCVEPTTARFLVWLVVKADDRALERLWDLVPAVAAAVDEHAESASVSSAEPATYPTSGAELPAYTISVDYSLGG